MIEINDAKAYIISYVSDNNKTLVWQIDNKTLSVDGNISEKTMQKIAENIS